MVYSIRNIYIYIYLYIFAMWLQWPMSECSLSIHMSLSPSVSLCVSLCLSVAVCLSFSLSLYISLPPYIYIYIYIYINDQAPAIKLTRRYEWSNRNKNFRSSIRNQNNDAFHIIHLPRRTWIPICFSLFSIASAIRSLDLLLWIVSSWQVFNGDGQDLRE